MLMSNDRARTKILVVCTANICRSPAAQVLFERAWNNSPARPSFDLSFSSAGTKDLAGLPRCEVSETLAAHTFVGTSLSLPIDQLSEYQLILTMERVHRGPVLSLDPLSRSKVFTLVEAAQLATFIASPASVLDVASGADLLEEAEFDFKAVPPLPEHKSERWEWLLGELNAWRGQVPLNLMDEPLKSLDITDPHDYSQNIHEETFMRIELAVTVFIDAITEVMSR